MIGWVTRNVISRNREVMLNIYKSLIRSHLEYCTQLWNPTACHGNWSIILEIEGVQRSFTRLIDGMGTLTYEEHLQNLGITTLLERRTRGDLIECFKIYKGIVNYGQNILNISRSGYNIVKTKGKKQADFLPNRAANYWNKLPTSVKDASNVETFKARLESFKQTCQSKSSGNYWDLSDQIFKRLESSNRAQYVDFMVTNPAIAARRNVNLN